MKKILTTLFCVFIANAFGSDADTTKLADKIGTGNSRLFDLEKNVGPKPITDGPRWIEVKGGKWHLSDDELATMQEKLRQFFGAPQVTPLSPTMDDPFDIRKATTAKGYNQEISAKWQTYAIQYQGQHNFDGQFVKIEGNCMSSDEPRLREKFEVIFDGGACVFNVKYNPVTQQFFDFSINGYA
jgi:hypothetical protein